MIAVGIVNESAAVVDRLRRAVRETPGFAVAWTARNSDVALLQHRAQPAQLVLFDVSLSEGPAAIGKLIAANGCVVLVVTQDAALKRQLIFAATQRGAQDAVATPGSDKPEDTAELRRKLTMLGRLPKLNALVVPPAVTARKSEPPDVLIGIGASTGGPQALAAILRVLPAEMDAAIVIVQHLDEQHVPGLQQWLRSVCPLPVVLAAEGDVLRRGTVLLAHTQDHLVLEAAAGGAVTVHYTPEPEDAPHRPSVDVFFDSLAKFATTKACCGVLLTGMGRDGAQGLLRLRGKGVLTIAQDQESSAVYGMPQAALAAGAVDESTPLSGIGAKLVEFSKPT